MNPGPYTSEPSEPYTSGLLANTFGGTSSNDSIKGYKGHSYRAVLIFGFGEL
jgi:hypothetical protein